MRPASPAPRRRSAIQVVHYKCRIPLCSRRDWDELVASSVLMASLVPGLQRLRILGTLIPVAVMSGAVSFHLFPPVPGPGPPIYTSAFDDIAVQR